MHGKLHTYTPTQLAAIEQFHTSFNHPTGLFCLILWVEEETFSVVPCNKVVSPSKEDLTPGCMCKVKKFEKCLAQVKAIGKDV